MNNIIEFQILQFFSIYLLLIIVLFIMKKCRINKTKLLFISSFKMSIQLFLAGLILTYILKNPQPIFTIIYLIIMISFSIYQVISKNKNINIKFKIIIAISMTISILFVISYFIYIVIGENIFNPQYVIPISGMIVGNTMTGILLGLKNFQENILLEKSKINTLICIGVAPNKIIMEFVKKALETAMLPTINSMIAMGIISLPGMMTGQILSGTLPITAILYQISIIIAICTSVTSASFLSLYLGSKTLYNTNTQTFNENF